METKILEGEIQNLKEKALAIDNVWFGSFKEITGFNKGDLVKVTYKEREKNGVIFHNIISITKLNKEIEIKPITESLNLKDKSMISSQLISYSKDIYVAQMESKDYNMSFDMIVDEVIKQFKKIKDKI